MSSQVPSDPELVLEPAGQTGDRSMGCSALHIEPRVRRPRSTDRLMALHAPNTASAALVWSQPSP